jgi:carboxylate-amine ligase
MAEDILPLLNTLAPYAAQLRASSALEAIEGYVRNNDSDTHRIRQFIADGGLLTELMREHCEIWATE